MAYYYYLRDDFKNLPEREFVVNKLIKLKEQISRQIPLKQAEDTLTIATWNIRDFGKINRRGFGNRTKDSHYYIAEILSSFDLIAVQEINELAEWEKVMKILGPSWDYIATDITHEGVGGNGERLTFVFDKRKVWFKNIAGEVVLPNKILVSKSEITESTDELVNHKQFRRTPYVVSFQSSWFKFDICTVHIYYGEGQSGLEQRIVEIKNIAKYLSEKADKVLIQQRKATILLGDFNIIKPNHKTMLALEDNGFIIPKNIKSKKTNVLETMHYDQIAFKCDHKILDFIDTNDNSGVFKIFESLYEDTDADFEFYKNKVLESANGARLINEEELRDYYKKEWRTYQMSDHNLIWVRVNNNDSKDYLLNLLTE